MSQRYLFTECVSLTGYFHLLRKSAKSAFVVRDSRATAPQNIALQISKLIFEPTTSLLKAYCVLLCNYYGQEKQSPKTLQISRWLKGKLAEYIR